MKNYFYAENADVFPGVTARSKAAQDYERFVQRTIYPHIIHPYSKFRIYWEIAMLLFVLCQFVLFHPIWLFTNHDTVHYLLILHVMLLISLIDLVFMFFTGYVEDGTGIVVLDPKRIIRRYLLRSFIPDLASCVPSEALTCVFLEDWSIIAITPLEIKKPLNFIVLSPAVQIYLRMISAVRYLRNTSRVMFWNPFIPSLISIFFCFILLMNFYVLFLTLCIYVYEVKVNDLRWDNLYGILASLINIPLAFLFENSYFHGWMNLIRFPSVVLSFICTLYLTAYCVKYMRYKMKTKERFHTLDSDVRIFMRKNRLPSSVKQKTLLYFKVFIKSKHYKEDEIFNYFPETFKSDIFSHLSLSLLRGFYAFEELPIYVLRRLAENLRYQLYLPNEVVMMRGETKLSLYFVQTGTVALYTTNNTELYHFEDGSSFNGKHFIDGKLPKHHYAISVEVSEIYKLDQENFLEIMGSYPKLLERMKEKFYNDIMNEDM